jgi:hypothetical protein
MVPLVQYSGWRVLEKESGCFGDRLSCATSIDLVGNIEVNRLVPGARLEAVRESAHLSPIDQPGQLAMRLEPS